MQRRIFGITLATTVAICGFACANLVWAQQKQAAPKAPAKADTKNDAKAAAPRTREAEEKAVRTVADAFVKAYNAHDAQAIANLFTADAELVDEAGDARQGRNEIAGIFSAIFQAYPDAQMSLTINDVRLLAPGVAVEDGLAAVVHEKGNPPEHNRYVVTHIKQQDGKWLM